MTDRANAIFFLKVIAFSICIGALTPIVLSNGYDNLPRVFVAGLTGLIIGTGCLTAEISFLSNRSIRWLRQTPLIVIIGIRAVLYSIIIAAGIVLPALVILGERLWQEPDFTFNFTISAIIASVISMSVELMRLLGREATAAIFTGRYRRPRLENRIVLFADLIGSTALAERLGDLRFHEFLADVSYDVSGAIDHNGGEVHRYVGDAIIVTWPMGRAGKAQRFDQAVACAQQMPEALRQSSAEYLARYGQEAHIRVAVHCGPVAAGEMGTWKKEIALLGDTMNTAARMENAARAFGAQIVISDAVKMQLSDDVAGTLTHLPDYEARGKNDPLALWTLREA